MTTFQWKLRHLVVILLVGAFIGAWPSPGTASATQPYGGCDEAWQARHSEGADWCRDHGWTVRKRVILNPHGVLRYWDFDSQWCEYEDGSGTDKPCGWLGPIVGNGRGLSYFVYGPSTNRHFHYLWSPSPLYRHPTRSWVDSPLGDALAEGGGDADTRDWEACWTKSTKAGTTVVKCADGFREEW